MRRTMLIMRRLVLLAFAATGLLVVVSELANAASCEPRGCCPWGALESVVPAPAQPDPQYCQPQHCEPLLRH